MQSVDVIIPVFNEQECLQALVTRLLKVQEASPTLGFRFLFVNDGSTDASQTLLEDFAAQHPFMLVLRLTRNFGHQAAVAAGLDHATADYNAIIDADLQDPPELIPEMVTKAQQGFHVVYGQRRKRAGETLFKRASASAFYSVLGWLTQVNIPKDTGDFRVISREVVTALRQMRELHRFTRGMVPWTGFRATPFLYDRQSRFGGTTKYPIAKMVKFALDAAFSFSSHPLRVATYLGAFLTLLGALGALFLIGLRLFTNYTVPGITAVIVTVVIMAGIQNLMIGIAGEYIGRIFEQVKQRPLYVIQHAVNMAPPPMPPGPTPVGRGSPPWG